MTPDPYLASEDSALLRGALRGRTGNAALEIGAGNGGNLVELAAGFRLAVGSDIVRPSMRDWRMVGADFVLTDRGACFRDGVFDLVTFNPPYLPSGSVEDVAVDAGAGDAVPLGFLGEALRTASGFGRIVMLLRGDSPIKEYELKAAHRGFVVRRIAGLKMFYERLDVYEASKCSSGEPGTVT